MLKDQHAPRLRVDVEPVPHVLRVEGRRAAAEELLDLWRRLVGGLRNAEGLRRVVEVEVDGVEGALGAVRGFVRAVAVFCRSLLALDLHGSSGRM